MTDRQKPRAAAAERKRKRKIKNKRRNAIFPRVSVPLSMLLLHSSICKTKDLSRKFRKESKKDTRRVRKHRNAKVVT